MSSSLAHLTDRERSFGYATALLVNFIDSLGAGFLIPVIFALGTQMGASASDIATFGLVRGFFMLFSTIGLSMLSDCTSRRFAVFVSITGSGVAYVIQAVAGQFYGQELFGLLVDGVLIFTIGRAVAGAFAGTSPVLRAFVSDLYYDDQAELKQKMVTMQTVSTALGLGLGPIAGSIGRYAGLVLPIWIAVAASVFGSLWVLAFFPSPKAEEVKDVDGKGGQTQETSAPTRSPYCDPGVLCFMFGFVLMVTNFAGVLSLLIPNMLFFNTDLPFAELTDEDEKARSISQLQGLLGLPNGVAGLFVTIFLFTPVTERFGEAIPLGVCGVCASLCFLAYGQVTAIWQLFVIGGFLGGFFGMILPSVGPIMAKYAQAIYPTQKAAVQAVPMMGVSIGMMVGPNFLAFMEEQIGDGVWFVCAGLGIGGTIFLLIAISFINAELNKNEKEDGPKGEVQKLEDTITDPQVFAEFAGKQLTEHLLKTMALPRGEMLKYRPVQSLLMARVMGCVPDLPPYTTETKGEESRQALYEQMGEYEGLREEWEVMWQGFNFGGRFHEKDELPTTLEERIHSHMDNIVVERRRRTAHRRSMAAPMIDHHDQAVEMTGAMGR